MTSSRNNYTSPSYRTGSSSSTTGGTYSSSRASSYSFTSCGTAKFSSLLSSSSSFSPSSYLSDKYSHSAASQITKSALPKFSSGLGNDDIGKGGSKSGIGGSSTTKGVSTTFTTTSKKSTLISTSTNQLAGEKSSGTDGFRGGSNKSGTTSEPLNFRTSSSYLRRGPVSDAPNSSGNSRSSTTAGVSRDDGSLGNVAKKSVVTDPSAISPSYYNPAQPNAGNRATTELKLSTGGGGVTYGAIGSSAIASLRTTAAPRYGLKTNPNLKLQSSYKSYSESCTSLTSGSSRKDRVEDDFSKDNLQPPKPRENKGSPLSFKSRGTSPLKDETELPGSTTSSKISTDEEFERRCPNSPSKSDTFHKEIQTDKVEMSPNEFMKTSKQSSIPRPSMTSYNTPFASALSRFSGGGDPPGTIQPSPINLNKMSDGVIKLMTGTSESSSENENSSSSGSIKNCKTSVADSGTMKEDRKGIEKKTSPVSTPCQVPNGSTYYNNTKPSSSSQSPQRTQNSSRPPADPNKTSPSRSSSRSSTIPTPCSQSPTLPLASPLFKNKFFGNNTSNSNALRKSGTLDSRSEESSTAKGRRGSQTSTTSSTTSSRSSSGERPSTSAPSNRRHIDTQRCSPPVSSPSATSYQETSQSGKHSWIKRSPEPGTSPWWLSRESTSPPATRNPKTVERNWEESQRNSDKNENTKFEHNSQLQQNPNNGKFMANNESGNNRHGRGVFNRSLNHEPLEDRTSPDGTEIPSPQMSTGFDQLKCMPPSDKKQQLFVRTNTTNIDDILGTLKDVSPVTGPNPHEYFGSAGKVLSDVDSSKNGEASVAVVQEQHSSDSDSGDDDEDGASSYSCSSFEEVDLRVPRDHDKPMPFSPQSQDFQVTHPGVTDCTAVGFQLPSELSCQRLQPSTSNPLPSSSKFTNEQKLDDATLQIYRDGEYGPYLDLEASINEQHEEFESFLSSRKTSIVLRAQLPVRVNAIIEKLLTADGRELRRALFSLKQIFQEDKDLVHEFVENGGLGCLIKVGSEADQNYQNYILRALGQLMLYVDGMYGVMRHNETIQWLYSLVASKFRLVQKTALKLLLVFVDYVETNCLLLVEAVSSVDSVRGAPPWTNVMNLLHEYDSGDTELLTYAMSLVNKVLNGIPDIDTYYDQVDALEEQGMAALVQKYMGKQCADLDLLQQLQIYELVLKHEDGEQDSTLQLDESMRQKLMNRKGYIEVDGGNSSRKGRRKSRRHSTNSLNVTPPRTPIGTGSPVSSFPHSMIRRLSSAEDSRRDSDEWSSSDVSSTHSASPAPSVTGSIMASPIILNAFIPESYSNDVGITPGLRKLREHAEYQRSQSREFQGPEHLNVFGSGHGAEDYSSSGNPDTPLVPLGRSPSLKRDVHNVVNTSGVPEIKARPWALPIYPVATGGKSNSDLKEGGISKEDSDNELMQLRENTVKDLTQKLANQNLITPQEEGKGFSRLGDLSGIILKAKEGLAKSKSKADIKPTPSSESNGTSNNLHCIDNKKSDNELHWDFLVSNLSRSLEICDLDFTGLKPEDDILVISPHTISQLCNMSMNNGNVSAPPPPMPNGNGPPPPPPAAKFPAPPKNPPAPPIHGISLKQSSPSSTDTLNSKQGVKKTKKTVKLFWKEVREDPVTAIKVENIGSIWDELQPIPLDTQKLEHLFESRAKDIVSKKQQEVNKFKEVVVLDPKRSNAINIGMTKLAPPRTIKTAIMKMDSTIINREGIEKLLTMLPTDEERAKIQEAQYANPDTPLGNAEQFLLTLASISELTARLKLWAFKLDYENLEKEIAEPLMDLKLGIEALQTNKTFRCILSALLCIGNFLNGADAKGFQIDYLAKVPEVKDTVHKHSLLHHLCNTVNEKFPESTDLYSEIGPVTRASRVDFEELAGNLSKMETDCKASWDFLRVIAKHDGPTNMKLKMSEFLADCAERIIVLGIIHRRVTNRFHKFLLWLGVSAHQVPTTKPHYLFKVVSEFALEYRTTREQVIQQLQKKANHRERNKTRGKLITEQIMYTTKEDRADAELRQVLNTSSQGTEELANGALSWIRRSKEPTPNNKIMTQHNFQNRATTLGRNGVLADGDDEILESLVKTATQTPATRTAPRERKRINSRFAERKSLRRTLRHGLTEDERQLLTTFMGNGH